MLASHLSQSFGRQQVNSRLNRSQVRRQKGLELAGAKRLLQPVGKMLLVLCPIWLASNLILSFAVNQLTDNFTAMETARHELRDQNIGLRAQKAQLFSPNQVGVMAGEKLNLHVPAENQVARL
ncbi:MAG: hypothetical protein H8E79_03650 [Desulfobulbaceae bacterium]|uniref:Cell division protein FtsL n=1 Tax=Candidatus Desulfatifera sulfidica TaxID=2841691 RepID=A0A8J6N5Y7_9BACT|nr:hypothetical protein [Candidatus Desulfatifera sulfidica]